jgi:hypothetical protein
MLSIGPDKRPDHAEFCRRIGLEHPGCWSAGIRIDDFSATRAM